MQENYKQQVIDFFNGRTAYDSEGKDHPEEAKRLLEYVSVKPGQTILDIATGTGLVAIPAAKIVAPKGSVIGVDISTGMLAQAKAKIKTEGIKNLELIEIKKHIFRRDKINDNYGSARIEKEFYPRGNPLLNLSEAQKELLQAEYKKAVDRLIAKRGVWQESINLYVKAWK